MFATMATRSSSGGVRGAANVVGGVRSAAIVVGGVKSAASGSEESSEY